MTSSGISKGFPLCTMKILVSNVAIYIYIILSSDNCKVFLYICPKFLQYLMIFLCSVGGTFSSTLHSLKNDQNTTAKYLKKMKKNIPFITNYYSSHQMDTFGTKNVHNAMHF